MLIEFRVENHRSLRDEQVLTMEAGRVGDDDDPRPRKVAGHSKKLLTVAALYGANASGKSNVLSALAFLRNAVLMSHWLWRPDQPIPRAPFAWGDRSREPSLYEATLLIQGVRHQYGFRVDDERVAEEWLRAWPQGKKQDWFTRDGDKFKFSENLKGENQLKLIKSVTRPNALFLSTAAQHGFQQLLNVFAWFENIKLFQMYAAMSIPSRAGPMAMGRSPAGPFDLIGPAALGDSNPSSKDSLDACRKLLTMADMGIVDLKLADVEPRESRDTLFNRRVRLRHQSATNDAWLPLGEESRGTQRMFELAWPLLTALKTGGVLVIDEIEASLHPMLAQDILRWFNDPETNPKNAQLLFTTHDTGFFGTTLGETALRRDQIWLTEKDPEGATVLYPMTDYKPRKAESLERGYLQGRYGAIPFLGGLAAIGG